MQPLPRSLPPGLRRAWILVLALASFGVGCSEAASGDATDVGDVVDATDTSVPTCDDTPVSAAAGQVLVRLGDSEASAYAWPVAVAHDVDGTVLDVVTLSCDLAAALDVPDGGSVSVIDGAQIETVMQVAPGDTIGFGATGAADDPLPTVAAQLPMPDPGIVQFGVGTGCDHAMPERTDSAVVLAHGCADGPTFDVLGVGISPGFFPLGWTAATDVDPAETSIDLPPWNDTFDVVSLRATGLPDSATEVLFEAAPVRRGAVFEWPFTSFSQVTDGEATVDAIVPPGFGDAWSASARVLHTPVNTEGAVSLYWWPIMPADTVALDVAFDPAALPHITSYAVDGSDPRQPVLSWALSAPLAHDFGRVALRDADNALWQIVIPAGATSPLTLPQLPDEMAGGRVWAPFTMTLVDSPQVDDYASIRPTVAADGFTLVRPTTDTTPVPSEATRWAVWTPVAL